MAGKFGRALDWPAMLFVRWCRRHLTQAFWWLARWMVFFDRMIRERLGIVLLRWEIWSSVILIPWRSTRRIRKSFMPEHFIFLGKRWTAAKTGSRSTAA